MLGPVYHAEHYGCDINQLADETESLDEPSVCDYFGLECLSIRILSFSLLVNEPELLSIGPDGCDSTYAF